MFKEDGMTVRVFSFGISLVAMSVWAPSAGFSQVQAAQNRIPQQIVINGQMATGVHVSTAEGQIQSYTCPSPQHYTTADGSSQGWACYEQTTGVWLLNAVPPSRAQAAPAPAPAPIVPQVIPQQPPVYQQAPPVYQQAPPVYQQAPPVVVYQTQPAVIYQPAPAVIYQQPPTVIYEPAPTVVYAPVRRPVVVAPAYPSSVVLGAAAIDAAGRIASAAILDSHHSHYYYYGDHDRRHNGRRW
jgi:hypothetical protein